MITFHAEAEACWYIHPQITRLLLLDYISNSGSHRTSSLTCNFLELFFSPREIQLKDVISVRILDIIMPNQHDWR